MIYELKNDEISIKISSLGAELQSIIKEGKEYLWQGNPEYWEKRAIVLFPVVGRCLGGKVEIDGKDYEMPSHGFAQGCEFELYETTKNSCTLFISSNSRTKLSYPYDFRFYVKYSIVKNRIECRFCVENTDTKPLYYTIGGHPGFSCPNGQGTFEDWELVFEYSEPMYSTRVTDECFISNPKSNLEKNEIPAPNGHISLNRELFLNDAMIFEDIKSKKVTLQHKSGSCGVTMDYSDFPIIAAWTLPCEGADYVCLEPWCGMGHIVGESAELIKKRGVMPVYQGKRDEKTFSLEIF